MCNVFFNRSYFTFALFCLMMVFLLDSRNCLYAGPSDKPKEQAKTAEQVKKNIQVLKGLPASQLDNVMNYMAASLGVKCNHCHVIDSTGWYMEKDDKKPKLTARKMIQMVLDLNKNSFAGRSEVTCYTCHRGSTEPAKLIPLPPPIVNPEIGTSEDVSSLPNMEQMLTSYETALGGADALKKITSRVTKGISIDMQGREIPIETIQAKPDKYLSNLTIKEGVTNTHAYNGTTAWMSSPRGTRELPPEIGKEFKKEAMLFPATELRELSKTLHVRGKETIDGIPAYVLSSPVSENEIARYYFDIATGLLVRKVVISETMIADIPEQIDYSDYRSVDGVKVPFLVKIFSVDSHDNSTRRILSIEQNVPIDEKKFEMPKGK